jgi:hypothetical protein
MHTIPTGAMEALTCLPPHSVVVQGEARSAVHWLWNLGCWFYPHPSWGHSCILMGLQKLDPIFSLGNYVRRPEQNSEPKYGSLCVTKEWTRRPGTPPAFKGLIWYTDGSRMPAGAYTHQYFLRQSGGFESYSSSYNYIPTGTTVPKGVEWHFHPPFCNNLLGPWTFWNMQKLHCRSAHEGGNCSPLCRARTH